MRKNLCLLPLALGTFGLGMAEFVMMGVLPDVANTMNISIPKAGNFISCYALGVAFGSILLVLIARTKPLKTILLWLMSIFTIANLIIAFVDNYHFRTSTWGIFWSWSNCGWKIMRKKQAKSSCCNNGCRYDSSKSFWNSIRHFYKSSFFLENNFSFNRIIRVFNCVFNNKIDTILKTITWLWI